MALIIWSDNYSVGVELFDNHHKKIVFLINKLHQAMDEGNVTEVIRDILSKLTLYTKKHFEAEEELMRKYSYPDYEAHLAHHEKLIEQVNDLYLRVNRGQLTISIQTMKFLRDWLKNHIMVEDKKYGPFLNSKGVY